MTTPPFGLINGTYQEGVNLAWNNYGADFGTGGWGYLVDWNQVTTQMATLGSEGVNAIRWWVFADGRYDPVFNANGTTAGFNSGFLADIDHVLQLASQNHEKILLTLLDNTMFNFASTSAGVQLGGHANIVSDPAMRQSFMDNALKPLLQHIAASPYASSVLGYDIINEPEAQIAGGYNGSDFFRGPAQLALSDVQAFVKQATDYIHTYGGAGALATVGSAMPQWTPLWQNLGLDFYEAHYYSWMDFTGPGSGLLPVTSITSDTGVHLDKPVVMGEFATADVSYNLTDTAVGSAEWYLNTIRNDGYAGALGWSVTAGDTASNWTAFQPVFTNWVGRPPPPPPPPGPPAAPTISSFSPDTAPVGDGHTTATTITLTGTGEASSTINLFDGTAAAGTTMVNTSGAWSITDANLAVAIHSFTATDTDANGTSAASPVFSVTVDAAPPPPPPPPPPPTGQLVTNGGFETGNLGGWTLGGNFTSTQFGPEIFITNDAQAGSSAVDMGSVNSDGTLSQTLSTVAGQQYTLDFWLKNLSSGTPNDFTAKWNGQSVFSLVNAPAQGYAEHTFTVTATGSSTVLEFDARQDPADWHLDTISVTPTGATTPPTVSSVVANGAGITNGSGILHAGAVVTLTVDMSEAVTVSGGTPSLTLNDGGTATYQSGSGSSALVFSYTVATGQNTPALTVTRFNANSATITDAAGNPANMAGAVTHPPGTLQVDTTNPDPDGPEPPVLTITSNALTVNAGGSVSLPISVAAVDSDDMVSVKISGLKKYESITDNLDNITFRPRHGSVTLTAAEVNSGLTLNSTYSGTGQPVNTLTVTATNSTAGETGTSAAQTITVTDPPANSSTNVDGVTAAALLAQFGAAGFQGGTNSGGPVGAPPSQAPSTEDTLFLTKPHS
jgi:hypothetical protein